MGKAPAQGGGGVGKPPPAKNENVDGRFFTGTEDGRIAAENRSDDARFRTQAGQSLNTYDSGNFAPHLRSVSVQKPEIIASLDFKPVWTIGSKLTNAGKFINTQISARRIRISDLRNLFSELTEDPDSEVGKLTLGLIESLEAEISLAGQDVDTVNDILSNAFNFSQTLNLKENSRGLTQALRRIRNKRLSDFTVPTPLDADISFRSILENNHAFSQGEVDKFSNTKLLSYMSLDLAALITGPMPPRSRLEEVRTAGNGFPQESFSFKTINSDGTALYQSSPVPIDSSYTPGRLNVHSEHGFYSNQNSSARPNACFFYNFEDTQADHGVDTALAVTALCRDFAMSSALTNDDFMTRFLEIFSVSGENTRNFVYRNLFGINGFLNTDNVVSLAQTDNTANFFDALIRRVDGQFVPTFDAVSSAYNPEELESVEGDFDSLYEAYIAPMIATIQDEDVDSSNIQEFSQEVPKVLRGLADSVEYMLALNNPDLHPSTVINQILQFLDKLLDDFEVVREGGLKKLPWLQGCLLNEAVHERQTDGEFDLTRWLDTRSGDRSDETQINKLYFVPMLDLLTIFTIGVSRSSTSLPGDPRFVDFVAAQVREQGTNDFIPPSTADFDSLAIDSTTAMVANLVQAPAAPYGSTINGTFAPVAPVENIAVPARNNPGAPAGHSFFGQLEGAPDTTVATNIFKLGRQLRSKYGAGDLRGERSLGTIMWPTDGPAGGEAVRAGLANTHMEVPRRPQSSTPFMTTTAASIKDLGNLILNNRDSANFASAADAILQNLFRAALERGPVLQTNGNLYAMCSSGNLVSGIVASMLGLISKISSRFFKARFKPFAAYYSETYGTPERRGDGSPLAMLVDFDPVASFHSDVKSYLEANNSIDAIPGEFSDLKRFLQEFNSVVDYNYRMGTDFVDFCRATAEELESAAISLREGFVQTSGQKRQDENFLRVLPNLRDMIDPAQVILAKKTIDDLSSADPEERYFDNFFVRDYDENNFYAFLKGGNLKQGKGDNIVMLYVGVPVGFTQKVLNIDPYDNPQAFSNERRVDLIVRKIDLQFGRRLIVGQKRFVFDLSTFFGRFNNSVSANPETRTEQDIDPFSESPNFFKGIEERTLVPPGEISEKYAQLKKINGLGSSFTRFKFSDIAGDEVQEQIFKNTVIDHLMKSYTRLAYGVSIDENSFFINPQIDLQSPTSDEIQQFTNIVNAQISRTLGRSVSFDNLLVGNRSNREVVNRLLRGERSEPVIQQVIAKVDGVTNDDAFLTSEDVVNFSRMFSYNNPISSPSSTRARATAPKVFERVFCIPVDPDDFDISTPSHMRPVVGGSNISHLPPGEFLQGNDENVRYKHISRSDGLPQAYQYQVLIVPHGAQEDEQA